MEVLEELLVMCFFVTACFLVTIASFLRVTFFCSKRISFFFFASSSLSNLFLSRSFFHSSFSIASCSFLCFFASNISTHSALVNTLALPVFTSFGGAGTTSRCLHKGDLNLADYFGVSPGRRLVTEARGNRLAGLETLAEFATVDCTLTIEE